MMNTMTAATVLRRLTLTRLFLESVFLVPLLMLVWGADTAVKLLHSSDLEVTDEIDTHVAASMGWLLFNFLLARNVTGWFAILRDSVQCHIAHVVFSAILLVMYSTTVLLSEMVDANETGYVYMSMTFYFMVIEVLTVATGVHLLRAVLRKTEDPSTSWQSLSDSKTCLAA